MINKNPNAIKLGEHLKALRKEAGIYKSRTVFANKIDESPQKISNYEHGHNFPTIEMLVKIHRILKKPFETLLEPLLDMPKNDIKLLEIIENVKKLYSIPEGRKELKKEIHKIELLLKESGKVPFEEREEDRAG